MTKQTDALKAFVDAWDQCSRFPDTMHDIEQLDAAYELADDALLKAKARPSANAAAIEELAVRLLDDLARSLDKEKRNTCRHESTHRGGAIWDICDDCGKAWAADKGGKPQWSDPPEWAETDELIAMASSLLGKTGTENPARVPTSNQEVSSESKAEHNEG